MTITNNQGSMITPALEERIRSVRLVAFDFDGVFTDNMVYVSEDGTEMVRCSRSDGLGLNKLKQAGIEIIIVSTETNPVVSERSRKLGIRCVQGCADKCATLKIIVQEMGLSLAQVAFVGNDINDLSCLNIVGLPMVVQDAQPEVIASARYQTSLRGGHGAVREICDLFERVLATGKR
jgi:YrbI family 3-deoxy-D-manno-octulosonate 8-phosphate phosphatase